VAYFSNFGLALDIVAPGVDIYSPIIDGYKSWEGTSMATPHVSGTIALMLEANPDLTTGEIKTALYETATPVNNESVCYGVVKQRRGIYWIGVVPCSFYNYGAGVVDAYGAVDSVILGEPECEVSEDCDDGLYCNGIETCNIDGVCVAGAIVNCLSYNNECNDGVCDEDTDMCIAQAISDETLCTEGICCGGICSAAVCLNNLNCFDSNICYFGGTCSAYCGILEENCSGCLGQVCDGKCHPRKEKSDTCDDCP